MLIKAFLSFSVTWPEVFKVSPEESDLQKEITSCADVKLILSHMFSFLSNINHHPIKWRQLCLRAHHVTVVLAIPI